MSYRDPGDSYIPPPPPKPKRSPWMFVGIGCGVMALLVAGAFGLLTNQIYQEIKNNPLTAEKIRQEMGDSPVYPGAEIDIEMTQAQYAGLKVGGMFGKLKAEKVATETRLTSDSSEDVHDYYWKLMTSRRYKSLPQPEIAQARAVLYRKDNDALLVQTQPIPKLGGNAIILIRFTNLQDDIGVEFEEAPPIQMDSAEITSGDVRQKVVPAPAKEDKGK